MLTTGCASIVSGQNQSISVTTPGCSGAACEFNNDKGKWYIAATPGSVTVNRSYADLLVKCSKGDFEPVIQSVPSKTKGMAFGNILFGGIIGAGVDVANGAAYDYPTEISLPYACTTAAQPPSMAGVKLGCKVKDLPPEQESSAQAKGVVLTSLEPRGLADRAGLKPGDVLVEFNSVSISNVAMLKEALQRQDLQRNFSIRYIRNGQDGVAEFKPEGEGL